MATTARSFPRHAPQMAPDEEMQEINQIVVKLLRREHVSSRELAKTVAFVSLLVKGAEQLDVPFILKAKQSVFVLMIHLFALTLRLSRPKESASLPDEVRAQYRKLRNLTGTQFAMGFGGQADDDLSRRRQQVLMNVVVRTGVLRCYAQLMSEFASVLEQSSSRRTLDAAREALEEAIYLLSCLPTFCMKVSSGSPSPPTHTWSSVLNELRESRVSDAWAACYLQLCVREEMQSACTSLLQLLAFFLAESISLKDLRGELVASAPALAYILTAHMVKMVATLDGGSSYGMPVDAPNVPLLFIAPNPHRNDWPLQMLRPAVQAPKLSTQVASFTLSFWKAFLTGAMGSCLEAGIMYSDEDRKAARARGVDLPNVLPSFGVLLRHNAATSLARVPPLRARAVIEIALRIAHAAVAAWRPPAAAPSSSSSSATAAAKTSRSAAAYSTPPSPSVSLMQKDCAKMAIMAVGAASESLMFLSAGELLGLPPAVCAHWRRGGKDERRLREVWEVYIAALNAALGRPEFVRGAGGSRGEGDKGEVDVPDPDWRLLVQECPRLLEYARMPHGLPYFRDLMIGAVLDAGGISCLERLLRQMRTFVSFRNAHLFWGVGLGRGPLPQLAALVRSAGKVIRGDLLFARKLLASQDAGRPAPETMKTKVRMQCFQAVQWIESLFDCQALLFLAKEGAVSSTASARTAGAPGPASTGANADGAAGSSHRATAKFVCLWHQACAQLLPEASQLFQTVVAMTATALPGSTCNSLHAYEVKAAVRVLSDVELASSEPFSHLRTLCTLLRLCQVPLSVLLLAEKRSSAAQPGNANASAGSGTSGVGTAVAAGEPAALPPQPAAWPEVRRSARWWRRILLDEVDVVGLLGACVKVLLVVAELKGGCSETADSGLTRIWAAKSREMVAGMTEFSKTLELACAALPGEMCEALGGQETAAADRGTTTETVAGMAGSKLPGSEGSSSSSSSSRIGLTGSLGGGRSGGSTGTAAAGTDVWGPLAGCHRMPVRIGDVEALSKHGEWSIISMVVPFWLLKYGHVVWFELRGELERTAKLMLDARCDVGAAAEEELGSRMCANPLCLRLDGPSELDPPTLERYKGTDGRRYCCSECLQQQR